MIYTGEQKKAQIDILYHVKSALCMSELPRSGRKAIEKIIDRIKNEINGNNNNIGTGTGG